MKGLHQKHGETQISPSFFPWWAWGILKKASQDIFHLAIVHHEMFYATKPTKGSALNKYIFIWLQGITIKKSVFGEYGSMNQTFEFNGTLNVSIAVETNCFFFALIRRMHHQNIHTSLLKQKQLLWFQLFISKFSINISA